MTVYQTNNWLEKSYNSPERIFQKLSNYFHPGNVKEVSKLLISQGMYHHPDRDGATLLKTLQKKNIWKIVHKEEQNLKREWQGKDLPIFIFPSDPYNRKIREHYKGKSGLAFSDKLFLFISDDITENELKALFTHEYNHCCRLFHDPKKESQYNLLDVIILEGLAENAIHEKFGPTFLAPWTSYYDNNELKHIWEDIILPNKDLPKTSKNANDILYGKNFYPYMAGYCVGYYLVNLYIQKSSKKSKELLRIPSEVFVPV